MLARALPGWPGLRWREGQGPLAKERGPHPDLRPNREPPIARTLLRPDDRRHYKPSAAGSPQHIKNRDESLRKGQVAHRGTGGTEHPRLGPARAHGAAGARPQVRDVRTWTNGSPSQPPSRRSRGLVSSVLRASPRGDAAPVAGWHCTGKRPGMIWDPWALSGPDSPQLGATAEQPQTCAPGDRFHNIPQSTRGKQSGKQPNVPGQAWDRPQSPAVQRTSHLT